MGSEDTTLTMTNTGSPHKSTGFSPNFMRYGRELFVPNDVLMGQPDGVSGKDELHHVCGLQGRLEDANKVTRDHLQRNFVQAEEVLWHKD